MSLAKHGYGTDPQFYSYLSLGSIFWIMIMVIGNFCFFFILFFIGSKCAFFGEIPRRDDFSDFDLP